MSDESAHVMRILLADDVKPIAALTKKILVSSSFDVAIVEDGEECLALAREYRPDLIILDLMMPKVHGMEVLRRLKSDPQTSGIGVVLCTARPYKPDHEQAIALGAFEILLKPFTRNTLLGVVNQFADGCSVPRTTIGTVAEAEMYAPSIPENSRYIRFWGTRGSIPVSAPRYARHGGNTSCVEVGCGGDFIIIDAGSGIREIGQKLAKGPPRRLNLLITHTHWDHIQGFPFFAPAFIPGFEITIHGATGFKKDLGALFRGQLDSDYFPVQFDDMRASIEFKVLEPELHLAGFKITWEYTHHPAATVGFKFARDGATLGYVSDNEFLFGYHGNPTGITMDSEAVLSHRRLVEFLKNVDLLVAEAQYTNAEYRTKVGWGHTSLSNGCALAKLSQARRWLVTHHDPLHDDDFLENKLSLTREVLAFVNCNVETRHAHDGLTEYW